MGNEVLTALSPWAGVDVSRISGLSPRLDELNGKTVGMFADFMVVAEYMISAVEDVLRSRCPGVRFSYIQYPKDPQRIWEDVEFNEKFVKWAEDVDCIFVFYGSVPSSSLFLGYDSAYMEKLGKPVSLIVTPRTRPAAIRGARAVGVPGLRIINYSINDPGAIFGHVDREGVARCMAGDIDRLADEMIAAVTAPLTDEEASPTLPDQGYADDNVTGTYDEICDTFYKRGWTTGLPVRIPTREAVDEMLRGTDLPPDHVVAYLPPKMGAATVEKIAVNAVMAGCLPTYLPILIASVKGCVDPRVCLEGWCCSQSTWGPMLTVSGPVVKDIQMNTGTNALSPYFKPNSAIPRAFSYIMLNIAGLRPGLEDLSEMGHENRTGFAAGDSYDENPWGPVHTELENADPEQSSLTLFWPQEHRVAVVNTPQAALDFLCSINPDGWDPGMAMVFTPGGAKMMADAGWTKERIKRYIVEYARHPASKVDIQWLVGNNHPPRTVELPENPEHSTRIFWSSQHMFSLVSGGHVGSGVTVYAGGGDHGGPSCTLLELPEAWNELVEEYKNIRPDYISY